MLKHSHRIAGAAAGFIALALAPLVAQWTGIDEALVHDALLALIAVAVGIDLVAVERRRRDPSAPGLPDDVRGEP